MLKLGTVLVCVGLFTFSAPDCKAFSTTCTQNAQYGCRKTVIESPPSGVIDGSNPIFTLKQLPLSGDPVQIFVNQVALNQGTDYRVSGQTVTLFGAAIPKKGDQLIATYQVRKVDTPSVPTSSLPQGHAEMQRLIHQTLVEAAQNDVNRQPNPATPTTPTIAQPSTEASSGIGSRSIDSLARRLDQSRKQGLATTSTAAGGSGTGPEGLGDLSFTSPFAVLLGAQSTDARSILDGAPATRGTTLHSESRAINMLQRRFTALDSKEATTTTEKR